MGLRLLGQKSERCFFITTTFFDHRRLGNEVGVYEAILDSLQYVFEKYSIKVLAYVLMPSHWHAVLYGEGQSISNAVRDSKKYLAQKSLKQYVIDGKLWQDRYDRVVLWSEQHIRTKIQYIHNNPVKAGLVEYQEDWTFSSARDYLEVGYEGPLHVWLNWRSGD